MQSRFDGRREIHTGGAAARPAFTFILKMLDGFLGDFTPVVEVDHVQRQVNP